MRKFVLTGVVALAMAAMVTGCGSSKSAADATTEASTEAGIQVNVDYTLGLNENGTLKDVKATDYVTLCDYKNIELEASEITATDDAVQSQIDSLLANYETTEEITDRASEEGDIVNIDYVGTVDGVEFEGGSAEGYDLTLGSHTFIDGFEDQLTGHKAGEKVTVEVTFPEDYSAEDLAGKAAKFETTINSISTKVMPELNDAFVKENLEATYGYTSVKNMKEQIKADLEENLMNNAVWNYVVENSTFADLPEDLIRERVDVYIGGLASQLAAYGATMDDYLSMYGYESVEDLYEVYKASGEQTLQMYLIADAIAEQEGLEVSEDKVKEYFATDDVSSYIETYTSNYVNRTVLNNLVEQFCEANVKTK